MDAEQMQTKKPNIKAIVLIGLISAALIAAIVYVVIRMISYGQTTVGQGPQIPEPAEPPPQQTIAPNHYTGAFLDDKYFIRYEHSDTASHSGIDVSAFQGEIDWEQVAGAGTEFAIIRAAYRGYTEGKIGTDERFAENMDGAISAGLKVGAYFFSQAVTPAEALEEADYICDLLEPYTVSYPVFFDWEDIEQTARTDGMTSLILTQCAEAFCRRVSDRGFQAGIYFNQRFGYQELDLERLQDWTLWLAEYNVPPTFRYDFDIWQYSCEGSIPGIETPVDLNLHFEEREEYGH